MLAYWDVTKGAGHVVLGTLSLSLVHLIPVPTHPRACFLIDISHYLSPHFNSLTLLRKVEEKKILGHLNQFKYE